MRQYPQNVVDHFRPFRPLLIYFIVMVLLLVSAIAFAQEPVPFEEPCPSGDADIDVTATLTFGNNLSFDWDITNNSDAVGIEAWTWTIAGDKGFDVINNAESVNPSVGSNNDGNRSLIVFYQPDDSVAVGTTHSRSGDIDGTVDGIAIKLEMSNDSVHELDLVDNNGTWSAMIVQAGSDFNMGKCKVFNQAMVWVEAGDERKLGWIESPGDVTAMELFYAVEGLRFPPRVPAVPFMTGEYPEGTNLHIWTPNRAGLIYFKVRACRTDIFQDPNDPLFNIDSEVRSGTTDEWILCSAWALSFDPNYTDPNKYPRGFVMLVRLPAATGGVIE